MNCLLRKAKNFEWSFKISLISVYKNFVINHWIILFKKFYLDKLKFRVKFYLDRIRFYLINERKRERWKIAIDMSWLASLWIVKFKRSIYMSARYSLFALRTCKLFASNWRTYTNGVTTRNQKKNKKRNVFMERWNELERCRDPIVMCSAKMVNRAVYGANRCCRSQRKNRFWPSLVDPCFINPLRFWNY